VLNFVFGFGPFSVWDHFRFGAVFQAFSWHETKTNENEPSDNTPRKFPPESFQFSDHFRDTLVEIPFLECAAFSKHISACQPGSGFPVGLHNQTEADAYVRKHFSNKPFCRHCSVFGHSTRTCYWLNQQQQQQPSVVPQQLLPPVLRQSGTYHAVPPPRSNKAHPRNVNFVRATAAITYLEEPAAAAPPAFNYRVPPCFDDEPPIVNVAHQPSLDPPHCAAMLVF
jgi:hypothetical protein